MSFFKTRQDIPQAVNWSEFSILISNYNFDEWGRIFDDDVGASAIMDSLVHYGRIFYVNSSSYMVKLTTSEDNLKRVNLICRKGVKLLDSNTENPRSTYY